MIQKWKNVGKEKIGDYRIFNVEAHVNVSPKSGRSHTFYVINSDDWVNVVPLTADNKVVLIHQYRHGIDAVTIEIPGGMVDEDENPQTAAQRELREETGFDAEAYIHIGTVAPNPAILNNRTFTYLARNAVQVDRQALDGTEDIAVELVDLAAIPDMIRSGRIVHSLVVAAFYHLENYLRQSS